MSRPNFTQFTMRPLSAMCLFSRAASHATDVGCYHACRATIDASALQGEPSGASRLLYWLDTRPLRAHADRSARMTVSRRGVATLGVLGGSFLAAIEATIVATAMPTVVAQFGGLAHYSWVFAGYLLTSTVTMPLWGKLSDLYGRRPFYLAAVSLFLVGSALSGAAQSMVQLIVFRAIQGVGAGGLLPLGMTILGDLYTLKERARTQGLFSAVWGLASIIGPLVGGYITEALSWRWVFYLNVPFGIVAAVLVGIALVEPPPRKAPRIDYLGALLMMASVALLMLALSQTGERGGALSPVQLLTMYGVAIVLGAAFVAVERRSPEPIVPLDLFADRLVAAVTVSGFLVGVAMFGAISYVPLFVQAALGGTAAEAGEALSPLLLGWVTMSIVTGRVLPRVGYRTMILGGLVLVTLGFVGLLQITHESPRLLLLMDLGLMGLGMGMTMLSLLLALQNAVPRDRLGVATSIGQFTRSIGGAIGVSMMGTIFSISLRSGGHTDPLALERALHNAFIAGAVVAALALLAALRVPAGFPARASAGPETRHGRAASLEG
jgi:EmrB/QacA subfamily drug resistance transporter